MTRVIVAEDDPLTCRIFTRMLGEGFEVSTYPNGEEALRHYLAAGADIILTDLKMPKMGGLDLLDRVRAHDPRTIVFVITGYSSLEGAVAAVKRGAYDYIAKPIDPDDVLLRINRALRERTLEETVETYRQERELAQEKNALVTNDPKMRQMLDLAHRAARTDSTILIAGETGVGKELVARMIHGWSPRRDQPFVPVNCGALAEGVLESELFGHEKGAFTGAMARRTGYFEVASRGTVFLDEIGTAPRSLQVKLLRVLQEREIVRVGSATPVAIDTRVIAATNDNLESAAKRGDFRTDLYYRLSVVTLHIPPLRERPDDIPLLAEHFLSRYRHINPRITGIDQEGLRLLKSYAYPGNVRELENIIERAMILENGSVLSKGSLLVEGADNEESTPEPLAMDDAEKEHILRVLARCEGKKTEAARILGINKTTLWRKMKRFALE